ncbi:MAG TPA: ORF6N domain-containing protein [Ginsengibacter sp.]
MARQKKNVHTTKVDEKIIRKIYIVREQKVMLDFDLADLYEVETKVLNQAVKRNIDRFPEDFMFRFTSKEWVSMRSQFVTSSNQSYDIQLVEDMRSQNVTSSQSKRRDRYTPYAFTEHGVTMLASILKSDRAIKMSIAVVRAFIELKKAALQYSGIIEQIQLLKEHLGEHDSQLNAIYTALENLMDDKVDKELKEKEWLNRKRIGFAPGK